MTRPARRACELLGRRARELVEEPQARVVARVVAADRVVDVDLGAARELAERLHLVRGSVYDAGPLVLQEFALAAGHHEDQVALRDEGRREQRRPVPAQLVVYARSIGIAGQYDAPEDDEDIFDRQRAALPKGALGTIEPPSVSAENGIDPAAAEAVQAYMRGELTTAEVAERLDRARTRTLKANALAPTP